jgi:exodeoxyribonuclease-3
MKGALKIISWNVNGIRAVQKKGFVEWLVKGSPDILCVQETKADAGQLAEDILNVNGYSAAFTSAEKKGYSGVAIYSKRRPKTLKEGMGVRKFDSEGRIQIADFEKFILCNIYFPNGKASKERLKYKMDFYEAFLKFAKGLVVKGRNVVVCGDVNTAHREIDLARPKENSDVSGFLPEEREWIDRFLAAGFVDTFRKFNGEPENYTWWDYKTGARKRNVGWRIDYFFVSRSLEKNLKDAFIMSDVMGSDHCPIGMVLKV